MVRKIYIAIFSLIGVSGFVVSVWYFVGKWDYSYLVAQQKDVKMWEADTRPLQDEKKALAQINKINVKNKGQNVSLKDIEFVVIPGLRGAWSINPKTKKPVFGINWVPQGVTQSDKNFYISVYDGNHRLNSLIFQVDKKTKKYVKTIILDSKAHVGGIVYDDSHKRLIYSNDTSEYAGFGYISEFDMNAYRAEQVQAPIHSKKLEWPIGSRTSSIALYDNQLLVAKYGSNINNRSIVAIPLDSEGLPRIPTKAELKQIEISMRRSSGEKETKKYLQILLRMKLLNSYSPAWDRLQGIAVSKSGLTILTQSNGLSPSKIWVQLPKNGTDSSQLEYTPPVIGAREVSVPASVEGVSLDSKEEYLTLVFESGAKKYRERNFFILHPNYIDRLIILPVAINGG